MTSQLTFDLRGNPTSVMVVRSIRRRRTITLGVSAAGIRVQAPLATSDAYLAELLRQRSGWLSARLERARELPPPARLGIGATVPYRGRDLPLTVVASEGRQAQVLLVDGKLQVRVPDSVADSERPFAAEAALFAWYRARAEEVLSGIVSAWSSLSGLTPVRVLTRNQRRRWGSCGADGTIRLNWRLILLEPELAEYVVVHELAHLRHRHHQATFWEEVARLVPDHRERRGRLAATRVLDYFAD